MIYIDTIIFMLRQQEDIVDDENYYNFNDTDHIFFSQKLFCIFVSVIIVL